MRISAPVLPEHVKAECARRIEEAYPLWKQMNLIRDGGSGLVGMTAFIDRMRDCSNKIEKRDPIPFDFKSDKHWG